jgi:histidinol-phosphatase (PHP family)
MFQIPVGDNHVHTDVSIDAKGSARDYCEAAFKKGLHEITFVTHYEITPAGKEDYGFMVFDGEKVEANADAVKRYIEGIRKVGEEFFPLGLKVLCGIEIGWHPSIADRIAKELPSLDLDMVMGSVHEVNGAHIVAKAQGPDFFKEHEIEDWIGNYFKAAEEIAESGLFDTLEHLDMYKRYGLPVYGDELKNAHAPYIGSLFDKMVKHHLTLEVNTSAIRHGLEQYYPSMDILNDARKAGVEVSALGSDAHEPDQVALDFEVATQIVHELLPCTLGGDSEL